VALWGLFGDKKVKEPAGLISPIQNVFRLYPEDTITPARYKLILKSADVGDTAELMELLDAAAADYKVASVLRTRKLSVAAADWEVKPGEDTDAGQKIADEAREFLESIPGYVQMKMDLLDAHYRGFAAGRLVRVMVDGVERAVCWQPIESRFFRFDKAHDPLVMTEDEPNGIPLPPEYLWHVVRDKPGPVTRGGTGRSIAKMWLYKGYFAIDMASYIEKYGQPHVQVTIPAHYVEGSDELERAKSAARSLIADHIGLVPEGVALELLETIKQTSTVKDTYIAAIQFCDEAIAMAETGHTLTSAGSTVGGLGHGEEARQAGDVKEEIKKYDARGLDETINTQLLWPRHLRMYGPKVPRPRLHTDVDEPENEVETATAQKLRAETRQILAAIGLTQSVAEMREEFDVCAPAGAGDELTAPEPPAAPNDDEPEKGPKKKPAKKLDTPKKA
jgi:phage gp29-like protein